MSKRHLSASGTSSRRRRKALLLALCSFGALQAGMAQSARAAAPVDMPMSYRAFLTEEGAGAPVVLAQAERQVAQGSVTPPSGAPGAQAPQTPTPAEAAAAALPEEEPDAAGDALRLQVLQARAQLGLGHVSEARGIANSVLAQDPNNVGALRVTAAIEETSNRWQDAAQTWGRVYELSNDPAAQRRREELIAAHPSQVTIAGFFEGAIGADEQYGVRASGAYRPLEGPEWDALLEQRHAEDDFAIALNGDITPISIDRQRLEVGVSDVLEIGRVSGRLVATNDDVGARAGYGHDFGSGAVDLTVGVNEPYWLFSEGIENEATIDYAQVSAAYRWNRVSARGSVRAAQFAVADSDDVGNSTRVTVGVEGRLTAERNPLILSYILDAESYDSIEVRTRTDGSTYSPMPFTDREVHSLGLYKTLGDTQHNFANLGLGYRTDAEGADGPFGSVWAEHEVTEQVTLGVRAEYSAPSVRGEADEDYTFAELYLRRRF